ncbi:MAG: helix-turn-helix domain-containing protein [Actinobacteria bacterium]|nr:helix-turn-helix domain-containing protein [Actinomycetota bacterium]
MAAQRAAPVHGRWEWQRPMSEFERLLGAMRERVDALVDATLERIAKRFPDWAAESVFGLHQVRAYARAAILTELRDFGRDALPLACPEPAAIAARAVARTGELEVFANAYRSLQATLWEAWFELVEDASLEPAERRELLRHGSDFFFRYADLLGDFVTKVYREELARLHADAAHRRFNAVKALLEGDPISLTGLDFDLGRHHLGLIAWGPEGERAARELASALARPILVVTPIPTTHWAWISGTRRLEAAERRLLASFGPPAGAGLAVGLDEFGEQGFRATHRQAQRVRLLAPPTEPSLTLYSDVAVEALATENAVEARNFVARELGEIDEETNTARRIRETLTAYFAAEHNAASAAAGLGIHQQTVANRLRAAEEMLGHSIGSRRVELELALRLRAALTRPADS